jgi:hypothetical protein
MMIPSGRRTHRRAVSCPRSARPRRRVRCRGLAGQRRRRLVPRPRMRGGECPVRSATRARCHPDATARRTDWLEAAMALRRLHERDLHVERLRGHDAVHPAPRGESLTCGSSPSWTKIAGRRMGGGGEVVNHDCDVLHPFDRHGLVILTGHRATPFESGRIRAPEFGAAAR